ncbi:hypothetical protein TGRH88_016160 [Toxoplasma gondii]|uniref:Transmembrane protein n=1 Tax=Toxoplasma gondii TaxID=5811 RepID=A0A7J6KCV4_TOXGO|nr:hypothetical protein TGRH88_016160 [Toxoplasma gondii]
MRVGSRGLTMRWRQNTVQASEERRPLGVRFRSTTHGKQTPRRRPLAAFCFSGLFSDAPFFSVWTRGRSCRRRASLPVYTSGDQATAFCGAGFSFLCLSSSFLLFLSPLSVDRVQAANACVRFFLAVV